MTLFSPIIFEPLAMERVWGGRRFETLLGKKLPHGSSIGELWEMVDRPETQSVVHEGDLRGKTLQELWTGHREEIFGARHKSNPSPRFPLLIKLLDARERLSVQVHPPAHRAMELSGEPKTECWYFLHASPGASVYAGLREGVTRSEFERTLLEGTVESTLHRAPASTGESIFIPSGRLHAIGEGLVIVEVQQNSDTTYRVFDWNRVGLDGKPRTLHIQESLESIHFDDIEPDLAKQQGEILVECDYFKVEKWLLNTPRPANQKEQFAIFTSVHGSVDCGGHQFKPGDFFLVPAGASSLELKSVGDPATVLRTTIP